MLAFSERSRFKARPFREKGLLICALLAFLFCLPAAHAVTFDWDQSYGTWTGGAPAVGGNTVTQSYDNDSTHAGTDLSISITNTNGTFSGMSWESGYPQVSSSPATGGSSGKALELYAEDRNSTGLVVKIDFNYTYGVNNVVITLWDVDESSPQFIDIIDQIVAVTVSGQTVGATTITTSSANTRTGTGTNSVVTGTDTATDTTSRGNVIITFSTSEAIDSVSFRWSNDGSSQGQQWIALADFSYTVATPEVGSSLVALLLCGGVVGAGFIRKRRSMGNASASL